MERYIYKNSSEDRPYLTDYVKVKDETKEHSSIMMRGRRTYKINCRIEPGGMME